MSIVFVDGNIYDSVKPHQEQGSDINRNVVLTTMNFTFVGLVSSPQFSPRQVERLFGDLTLLGFGQVLAIIQ